MIRVLPFANALAVVFAACYLLAALLALVAPGLYLALLQSWVMLSLTVLSPGGVAVTASGLISGLVTAALAGWLIGLALGALYNAFAVATEARPTR